MDKMLTPEELSDVLRIPVQTLYQWRTRGKGPAAVRVGRHLRYRRADVDLWLEQQYASGERAAS